ncbi:MAG TPA: helix-turn-helix domain-containing protein [Candidatus Acidoferrales bacterium]|jgi:excisionase family DNA binding protein|nr:helix-turn-helix domain-containing protein [Candidatus Acidoferrales bacterium]
MNTENSPETLMNTAIAAIRLQVLAELRDKTPAAAPTRRLLTAKQAGEYLGRSEHAIRQMIHKRQLPVVRDGRNVRLDLRDLDARIDDLRV